MNQKSLLTPGKLDGARTPTTPKSPGQCELNIKSGSVVMNSKSDIFRRFRKEKMIGQGSYGQVFKVVQLSSGKARALKVLDKRFTRAPEKGLLQEVDNVRKLDHPNVLRVYEVAEDSTNLYVISELSDGHELFTEIHNRISSRKPFTENEVASILRQLLGAIAYAHERNIIHRDIKPENILVETEADGALHVLVIDWGLSKDISENKNVKQRIGTVDYAAPEVLQGQSYDGRCDVWSCGVILYILLSGETPFPGKTTGEIERRILQSTFSLDQKVWKLVSPEAVDLVRAMLQQKPDKRVRAQQALDHPWFKRLERQTVPLALDVQQKLEKYCCRSKLLQAAAQFMVSQAINKDMQNELRQTFKALDTNGDGKLSFDELLRGMASQVEESELRAMFDRIDTDRSVSTYYIFKGFIDYTEFISAAASFKIHEDSIKEAFDLFDQDGNGFIELDELKEILTQAPVTDAANEEAWISLVKELDENGDGKISFAEFKQTLVQFSEDNDEKECQEPQPSKKVKPSMQSSMYNLRKRKN